MRPIVFIDVRTTGPDPDQDDIVEVAAICADPRTLEVEEVTALLVVPDYVGRPVSDREEPRETFLADALELLESVLTGALIAGVDVDRTLAFLRRGWEAHGHEPDEVRERPIEVTALTWPLMAMAGPVEALTLDSVCAHFGIEHPEAGALDRARCALEITRAVARAQVAPDTSGRSADQHAIVRLLNDRLRGRGIHHGARPIAGGHDYPRAALLEILDCLHNCAAELVRLESHHRKEGGPRTRRVYVCHPFGGDPVRNAERVRDICADLVREGFIPIAPALYLPQFISEERERELALRLCLERLDECDEVRVYGSDITEGMRAEIARAEARGIPVDYYFPLGAVFGLPSEAS